MLSSKFMVLLLASMIANSQLASSFDFKRCDNGGWAKLRSFRIDACPDNTGASCKLKRASNYHLDAEFITLKGFESAESRIVAIKDGKTRVISSSIACDFYGLNCPSTDRQLQQLHETTFVSASAELGQSTYRLNLTSEAGASILCLEFPVEILT